MRTIRLMVAVVVALRVHSAWATVTVTISEPTPGAAIGDSLRVAGTVTSNPFALSTLQAQVGSVMMALTPGSSFMATLDISSLPIGNATLVVTGTDAAGNTGSTQVMFIHDHPPMLTVTDPLPDTVARPMLHVAASCSDTDIYGCASLALHVGSVTGTTLASTTASTIDQMVAMDAYVGQQINLFLVATDTAGMSTATAALPIYVDTSPRLVEVQTVPAAIIDVDSTRILYGMTIRTRGTTNDVVLPSQLGTTCRLSPSGALCNAGEWKNGIIAATWPIGNWTFAARGNYAIWVPIAGGYPTANAFYRDSTAGTTTQMTSAGYQANADDVAENGDAVITWAPPGATEFHVYRFRGGVLTQLSPVGWFQNARTDGVNVAFYRHVTSGTGGGLFLYTTSGLVTLVPDFQCPLGGPGESQVRNGWTAYGDQGTSCGAVQVWIRAPDGTRTQLSVWNTGSTVDAMNDAGQVMMLNTSSLGSARYLASPGVFPEPISSPLGHARWIDNAWYVVMGRTLFIVSSQTPPPDGGTDGTDAGMTQDAGMPGDGSTPDGGVATDAAGPSPDAPAGGGGNTGATMKDEGCAVTSAPAQPAVTGAVILGSALLLLVLCRRRR